MFVDVLSAAKQFSLVTQKSDIDIISIVDSVESTKRNYEKLLRKFKADAENIFPLPTLKPVINAIESDEGGESSSQGQKLKYYTREKQYSRNHGVHIVRSILLCYEKKYSDVYSKTGDNNAISDGDKVLFDVCQVLNSAVWPSLTKDESEDDQILSVQLAAINNLFERFQTMPVFKSITRDSLQTGFVDVVWYAYRYFGIENIKPMSLWSKICTLGKDRQSWHDIMILIELC